MQVHIRRNGALKFCKRLLRLNLSAFCLCLTSDEGKENSSHRSQYTQSSYHTGREQPYSPSPLSPSPLSPAAGYTHSSGRRKSPPGPGEDDYSMTFSPLGGEENTSEMVSPLGVYRDSYGSESFESEN